ncbi:MAG TPA: PEGA domain-containing protein, partial [Myxococcales bacterium]|nr:PEGA domain-containing protein [Myxococcales bacterium]
PAPPPAPTAAAPRTFTAVFAAEEVDVDILVSGKLVGKTPGVQMANLAVGRDYSYVARKPGFRAGFGKFRSDGQPEVTIPVVMERLEPAAAPGAAVIPPKKLERGDLACATRPNGAQIFVDGRATGRTTPAAPSNPLHLPAGKHKITFKLNGKSVDRTVEIKNGQLETLTNIDL